MNRSETTRAALLDTAGELFAELGFDGVSTRLIADQAGVKLSAIHYHFGSKENLYIETCLTAHRQHTQTTFRQVISENHELMATPAGQAEIIRTTIFRRFHDHFRPDRPAWEAKILLREIASPSVAMTTLAEAIYRPDSESAVEFYLQIRPQAKRCEAQAWSDLLYGQILLYTMARKTIALIRGQQFLESGAHHLAAATLARAMILEAGLPLPADLRRPDSTSHDAGPAR